MSLVVPVPNLGLQVVVSDYHVKPTQADIIGDIRSISGIGFSVETVDATPVSSPDGFSRPAPTVKTAKPMTVTVFMNNEGYNKLLNKFKENPVGDKGFYGSLTIIYPKYQGVNDQVPDLTYHGFISDLSRSDAEANQVQTFSFEFTPTESPEVFTGFTSEN